MSRVAAVSTACAGTLLLLGFVAARLTYVEVCHYPLMCAAAGPPAYLWISAVSGAVLVALAVPLAVRPGRHVAIGITAILVSMPCLIEIYVLLTPWMFGGFAALVGVLPLSGMALGTVGGALAIVGGAEAG